MWEWLAPLRCELEAAIAAGLPDGEYRRLLSLGLAQEGKILSAAPNGRWPLLTIAACEVAGGTWDAAIPAAAAVEVWVAALDLLDDLEDGDPNPVVAECGAAQALNVSTGMLALAQRLLLGLSARGVSADTVLEVSREMSGATLRAADGQHLDLAWEGCQSISEAQALEVAARKSATLVACACRIGARIGTTDPRRIDLLGAFGWHLGLAVQLANDLRDVAHPELGKSDLRRQKATLPLAVAAAFGLPTGLLATGMSEQMYRQKLAESGVYHYSWLQIDRYSQKAADLLGELGGEFGPGASVGVLRAMLPT